MIVATALVLVFALTLKPRPVDASISLRQSLLPVDCIIDQTNDGVNSTISIGPESCLDYINFSDYRSTSDLVSTDFGYVSLALDDNDQDESDEIEKNEDNYTSEVCKRGDDIESEKDLSQDVLDRSRLWLIILIATNCLTFWLTKRYLARRK